MNGRTISPGTSGDLPAILALLTAAGLPVADLQPDKQAEFLVARHNGCVIGVVGLERFATAGLLRSLAVDAEFRRHGLGVALTQALEEHATRTGLASLVLLTETAADFFSRCGYQVIPRAQAPAAVQASSQFRLCCPGSAVCMTKQL